MRINEGYLGVQIKVVEEAIQKLDTIFPVLTEHKELEQGQQDIEEAKILLAQARARLKNVYNMEIVGC